MKYLITTVVPFAAGFVVCANLVVLVGHNQAYQASWWKVAAAVVFALMAPILAKEQPK